MKLPLLIAAVSLVLAPPLALCAEPDSTATPARPNSLYQGARAIQFLSSDWTSSGSIFFKQHRAANHALRVGLTFSVDTFDDALSVDTTTAVFVTGTEERDSYSLDLELLMQRYANVLASAHVFYGIGPFFSISSYHAERQENRVASGDTIVNTQDHDAWRVGARLILGGEWFISRALSLDMEYYVSGGYRSSHDEYQAGYPSEPVTRETHEGDGVFISGGSARIGLGIYF